MKSGILRTGILALALNWWVAMPPFAFAENQGDLKKDFQGEIKPFLVKYCVSCHGKEKPKAKFDLSPFTSLESVTADLGHWSLILKRLSDGDMPPENAKAKPTSVERQKLISWIEQLRRNEAQKNAGDPGPVLARRLSNAEYNYTIQDLTGVDIQPTKDFPVDPAGEAGFDNTGESLAMSPALLNKYLSAARRVADHLVFLPDGIEFAPHPVVVYSDRDKYSVHKIVDFYKKQPTDIGAYFLAAWRYRHREKLGNPKETLAGMARAEGLSARYLETVWNLLNESTNNADPIKSLCEKFNALPEPTGNEKDQIILVRAACEKLKGWVITKRKEYLLPIQNYSIRQLNASSQPLILAKDREISSHRRLGKLPEPDGKPETDQLRGAISRFCSVFPDTFYVSERGRMFEKDGLDKALDPGKRSTDRLLSAGFHLMVGYFRDDAPLYDLILNEDQKQVLDRMWRDLDFVTQAPVRQFSDFIYFERAEFPAFLNAKEFDFAREDTEITSKGKIERFAKLYLAKSRQVGIEERVLKLIESFFQETETNIRQLEISRAKAEPSHLRAILVFAERAWQKPLTEKDRLGLLEIYMASREKLGLSHEDALRDTFATILLSPRFSYRVNVAKPGREPRELSDYELASRLSYFLWSSLPDVELLEHAKAGDLHDPKVLVAQTRRMLKDPRARRLATEFGGNWLEFRRFQNHNGVNRDRFPAFTDELRQAMFEEPVRFLTDLIERDGSIMDVIEGKHTFVNRVLAGHYGIPFPSGRGDWVRIDDADRFGRGGLLPMSVFLTLNAPGLRTSPVKRGYWVVRRLLGEQIPPPPPEVPELPKDEAKLGDLSVRDLLARHRESPSCAKCHTRFDSIGLVFESYGPVGERRQKDLGGRQVDSSTVFPNGTTGEGLEGLKQYLCQSRKRDLIETLSRKLLAFGLGRSLLLSDESTVEAMKKNLAENGNRFGSLVETVVTSPQFSKTRGRDYQNQTE